VKERMQVDMTPWGEAKTVVQAKKPGHSKQTEESKEKKMQTRMKVGSHTNGRIKGEKEQKRHLSYTCLSLTTPNTKINTKMTPLPQLNKVMR
jgi:hypothetical protein